ncbi:hypothetical protein G6K86_30190 [Agrobacterium rhizogenes]|nr:hypothetical protein [Rhizobium rhizogenes]
MNIEEALACLGSTRVIWIDDHFNDTPSLLGDMLADNIEITQKCGFEELGEAITQFKYNEEAGRSAIIQVLAGLSKKRQTEIREVYFRQEDNAEPAPERELSGSEVTNACDLLKIAPEDRWPFDGYEKKLQALCEIGDAEISYMVDLKDSRGEANDKRGLDVIKLLYNSGSKGTAFILTHEASPDTESQTEINLRQTLEGAVPDMPLCVVSKERLTTQNGGDHDVEEALRVAIKRAGLKRSVHEVLNHARQTVTRSFDDAMQSLLQVPPEQLDKYAVERAYKEGVSEMHVIERALTAHISQQIRVLFGTDEHVLKSTQRLRTLRGIPLKNLPDTDHRNLTAFRDAEVWETEALINSGFAQIACGDVFEFDKTEQKTRGAGPRRFVLLAQPCDIGLRSNGKREIQTAVLAPLKAKPDLAKADNEKEYTLPFMLDDKKWVCDLRDATPVKLNILDLASFRADGIVRFDKAQKKPTGLVPGHDLIFADRTSLFGQIVGLCEADKASPERPLSPYRNELQLTFASPDAFKLVENGGYQGSDGTGQNARDARITWYLKRCGRIRMPFASAILDRYVGVVNRQAFDVDYMDNPPAKIEPQVEKATAAPAV